MALFYAIYNRQQAGDNLGQEEWEGAKLEGDPEVAHIVKISAENVAAGQRLIEHFFGGEISSQTVIVSEASYKES